MSELNSTQHAFDNAVNLLKDNNLNESIEQLHEILKIFPKHKDSIDLISDLFIKINEPKKALIYINEYLSISKNSQKHLENKYKIYLYLGEDKNAFKVLKSLHENYPSIRTARTISNYYLSNNDEEKSDLIIQSFFEKNKSYSDLYKGIRHAKAGRNKLAEESYKNVLSKDNKNVDALRLLGLLAFKNNNHDIAEKLLIRAIQLDPYFHLLWDNLAKVFRVQNKLEESKKAFENLIKLDPKNNEAFVALGTIYNKLAQYKDGINSYKKALKLNDNNARVYLSMGHALKTLGNRKECEDSYLKAIKLFPLSGEGYWLSLIHI